MNDPPKPHVPTNPILLGRARTMRHDPSPAEETLWPLLRGRRLGGFKFRRQVPLGAFVADFYCHEAGLVVELDGVTHEFRDEEDAVRTEILERDGHRVIRFSNWAVFRHISRVLESIHAECVRRVGNGGEGTPVDGRTSPHPGPLPEGEGG